MNNATIVKGGSINQIVPITAGVKLPIGVYDYSEYVGKGIRETPSRTPATPPGAAAPPVPPVLLRRLPSPSRPPNAFQVPVPPIPSPKDSELFTDGELAIHIIPIEFLPAEDMRAMLAPFLSNVGPW